MKFSAIFLQRPYRMMSADSNFSCIYILSTVGFLVWTERWKRIGIGISPF